MARIGIAGAGLVGRLLAWQLSQAGHAVSVFDPGPGPSPRFDHSGEGQHAAGFTAAGMLSPLAELDNAGPEVAALGWRAIPLWREITQALGVPQAFAQHGSLMLAHRSDLGAAQRVLARLGTSPPGFPQAQPMSLSQLAALEPALHGAAHAWLLPDEAHIHTVDTMRALHAQAAAVQWHWGQTVTALRPGALQLQSGDMQRFDTVIDARGVGARPDLPVRGVRGEVVWLSAPAHGLTRPVRLLHPRHRVYLVPRTAEVLVLGASEIESEDRSAVTLKSAVELMAAAHSVMPALAEARILRLDSNLRPALPDNEPLLHVEPGLLRINGLFRHGWLLAPALAQDAMTALAAAELQPAEETSA